MEAAMETQRPKFTHGQDAGKVILALWLLVSPWMFNYAQARLPVWNGDAVAIIVAVSSIAAMLKFNKWEEWISIVAGFWLIVSPLLLDYTALLTAPETLPPLERHVAHLALPAMANHLAVGLGIVILSLWEFGVWERATGKSTKA
jgi:hypothetical protein